MEKTIACPDCENEIIVESGSEVGDVFVCDNCGVEVEIIGLDPLEVDYLLVEK